VTLLVGDNITIEGQVNSNVAIFMRGDFNNADPGAGSIIHIPGTFTAPTAEIQGQFDNEPDQPDQHHAQHGDDGVWIERRRRDFHGQQFQAHCQHGGTLNNIRASLTIIGGTGADTWVADDTGDTLPNTGTLTSTRLSGLGITGSASLTLNWSI